MSSTDKIIRLKTVLARTRLSRSTMYRRSPRGPFHPGEDQRSRRRLARICGQPMIDDPVSYRNEGAAQ
jgi:prophage regulatory protein